LVNPGVRANPDAGALIREHQKPQAASFFLAPTSAIYRADVPKERVSTQAGGAGTLPYRITLPAPAPRFAQATGVLLFLLRLYAVGVPVLSRLETAVTS
jgi:hypothetical protein